MRLDSAQPFENSDAYIPFLTWDELQSQQQAILLESRCVELLDCALKGESGIEEFVHSAAHFIDIHGHTHQGASNFNAAKILGTDHDDWYAYSLDDQILETVGALTFTLVEEPPREGQPQRKIVWSTTWIRENEQWWMINSHASCHEFDASEFAGEIE